MQIIDVAVSLAKVADVDFALGKESAATEGFQEALKKLEGLSPSKTGDNSALEKKVCCLQLTLLPSSHLLYSLLLDGELLLTHVLLHFCSVYQ